MTNLIIACLIVISIWLGIISIMLINHELKINTLEMIHARRRDDE